MKQPDKITRYEHETLQLVDTEGKKLLEKLRKFHGKSGNKFYSLTHNGVKFNEHVGVLQIGDQLIEILPKADRIINRKNSLLEINQKTTQETEQESWRDLLIDMLKSVGIFDIKSPSSSSLKLKSNSILELYFNLYLNEVEYLIQRGFIKKYKKTEGNNSCLKGSILFGKNIQKNIVHQERLYTRYTTYSVDHSLHQIIYQAILVVSRLNRNNTVSGKVSAILLNFPEVSSINISESTFEKIVYNRGNEHYKNAISIARLILLNYHPDISSGKNNVLAIMFDMNVLWEKFVLSALRKSFSKSSDSLYSIEGQCTKNFWQSVNSKVRTIRPDIVIKLKSSELNHKKDIVLDTKWKNIEKSGDVSLDILRQMYVYHEYFQAQKVAIVFPGNTKTVTGEYADYGNRTSNEAAQINIRNKCALLSIQVESDLKILQENISKKIIEWIEE